MTNIKDQPKERKPETASAPTPVPATTTKKGEPPPNRKQIIDLLNGFFVNDFLGALEKESADNVFGVKINATETIRLSGDMLQANVTVNIFDAGSEKSLRTVPLEVEVSAPILLTEPDFGKEKKSVWAPAVTRYVAVIRRNIGALNSLLAKT